MGGVGYWIIDGPHTVLQFPPPGSQTVLHVSGVGCLNESGRPD